MRTDHPTQKPRGLSGGVEQKLERRDGQARSGERYRRGQSPACCGKSTRSRGPLATGSQGVRPEKQRPKPNAGPEQRPKLNAGPDTEAKTVHLRSVESGKEGGDDMGAPSAGLEVKESSGGYGNLRFDRLTPSNLEEEEKMM